MMFTRVANPFVLPGIFSLFFHDILEALDRKIVIICI